jgi:hypothetical protein
VLTKREENQLLVFERKVFRAICDPKIENDVYRKKYRHGDMERSSSTGFKQVIVVVPHK